MNLQKSQSCSVFEGFLRDVSYIIAWYVTVKKKKKNISVWLSIVQVELEGDTSYGRYFSVCSVFTATLATYHIFEVKVYKSIS